MVSSHGITATARSVMRMRGDHRCDIEIEADRRMAQADLHIDVDHDAEMDQIDAEPLRGRRQDRRHDQDDRRRLHEIAGHQQQYVHQQEESDPAEILRHDPVGERGGNILVAENERKQHGVGDDIEQHRAGVRGPQQYARHVLELQRLVDEHRDEE